jgi:hypothetical protein
MHTNIMEESQPAITVSVYAVLGLEIVLKAL